MQKLSAFQNKDLHKGYSIKYQSGNLEIMSTCKSMYMKKTVMNMARTIKINKQNFSYAVYILTWLQKSGEKSGYRIKLVMNLCIQSNNIM